MNPLRNTYAGREKTTRYTTPAFDTLLAKLPLGYDTAEFAPLLKDLQANILYHHRKSYSTHYFLHFRENPLKTATGLEWFRNVAIRVTTAFEQFKANPNVVCCFYLTWQGYKSLGLLHLAPPQQEEDSPFFAGMEARNLFPQPGDEERDRHLYTFGKNGQEQTEGFMPIHAMLLLAADDPKLLESKDIKALVPQQKGIPYEWVSIAEQKGLLLKKEFKNGAKKRYTEWFGFRESISQPLFFPDAIEMLKNKTSAGSDPAGTADPKFHDTDSLAPLNVAITRDRGGKYWYSAGSFMALLKLEQNVQAFRENVSVIKNAIDEKDEELAAAYIMGRFQDGTAVSLSPTPLSEDHFPENDFNYSKSYRPFAALSPDNGMASKCPFGAHIRKANPRNASDIRVIVRRGVLYDDRNPPVAQSGSDIQLPDWDDDSTPPPPDGVGMLFMSFQGNLEHQFEYLLKNWILSNNLELKVTGPDMLLGTTSNYHFSRWYVPKKWGSKETVLIPAEKIKTCVRFKGGEYFFAPSKSFLAMAGGIPANLGGVESFFNKLKIKIEKSKLLPQIISPEKNIVSIRGAHVDDTVINFSLRIEVPKGAFRLPKLTIPDKK